MQRRLKNIIKSHLLDYIKKVNPETEVNDKKNFTCPKCEAEKQTAQLYMDKITCFNPECKYDVDIFQYVKETNTSFKGSDDDDISDYIQHLLNIDIKDDTDNLIKNYSDAGFALIPLVGGHSDPKMNKVPIKEAQAWQKSSHKNPTIWKDWIERGYNIGLNLGKVSNVVAVDIDCLKTFEKVKHLLGDTLVQTTGRGFHYMYNYDPIFTKTLNRVLRDDGFEMELRTDGAYCVVAPSTCDGELRKWNNGKIIDMPKELKDFLLPYIDKGKASQTPDESLQECIDTENMGIVDLKGRRNATMTQIAGIFSKYVDSKTNTKLLNVISNNLLDKPLPEKELYAMVNQIRKYRSYDKEELGQTVLDRLEIMKEGSAFQIAGSLKKEISDIEDILAYLENEGKIHHLGNRKYQILNEMTWTTETNDLSVPIDFEIPWFSKHAKFDKGNMIILGAKSGTGKTHITGNLVKHFVDQGIKPYVINTEAGSKIAKITKALGVPDNSFYVPEEIPMKITDIKLPKDGVTILDWLSPKDGNFAEMGNTLAYFHNQLKKKGGFLIVLMQLRTSNSEWYAQDLVFWYGALVAKYLFGDNGNDAQNTVFKTQKIRDSRTNHQYINIPIFFDPEKKTLEERA